MKYSRRTFIQSLSLALLSESALAENFITDLDLGTRNDLYARSARLGKWKPVEKPIFIKFDNNSLQTWVYCSPNVDQAKLVIFSHDILVEPQIYFPLFKHLTSHGYCIIAPVHDDSFLKDGLIIQNTNNKGRAEWNFDILLENSELWLRRASDCRKSYQKFKVIANTINTAIDATQTIIIGHGFGAMTSQLLIGCEIRTAKDPIKLEEEWVKGSILYSPVGPGILGINENSFAEVGVPIMLFSGDEDLDLTEQSAEDKFKIYDLLPGYYRHKAKMVTGDHNVFSGQRAFSKKESEYYEFMDIKAATTLFLNSYVNFSEEDFSGLYSNIFDSQGNKKIVLESK